MPRIARLGAWPLLFAASYWDRRRIPVPSTVATCLLRFKHAGDRYAGRCLASAFGAMLAAFDLRVSAVVAIPPSPERARARALDPAAWLARSVAHHSSLRFRSDLLVRCRAAPTQRGLGGIHRRQNVVGAFSARDRLADGNPVLLIDDVCTTGSTLSEAARVLEAAGATVHLAVLACADADICRQCPSRID
ncbi:MAG TPA: phosphoribosyltransferase family protein [Candidatus Binatia bacterium]|nr:phosphoribosyltransferase family protein [Candidatus Binatia bacterium]